MSSNREPRAGVRAQFPQSRNPDPRVSLFYFHSCAGVDELLLDGFRFVLADALFNRLRGSIHQILGFL